MKCEFFMNMIPPTVTHQEKRIGVRRGKPIVYEDERLKDARAKLRSYLAGHKPERKLGGALRLVTKWCFPGKVDCVVYKTSKPDTDNLIKLLKDCMTELGFWSDDAQVASEITEKFTVPDRPGIYVCVTELDNAS